MRIFPYRLLCFLILALSPGISPVNAGEATLKSAFADDFLIGVALNRRQVDGRDPAAGALAAKHFSALTAENDMKWPFVHPAPGRYDFATADAYVDFAEKHGMAMIGHTLVWHSQNPPWLFKEEDGRSASREVMLARMRDHIHTVVGRYKGRIKGWDVVNEALADGGDEMLRDSPWRRIIGDDYLDHAFRFAREADPAAELYYNDYGLENGRKREKCVAMLRGMIARGVPVDGVGTQSHFHLNHPSVAEVEKTITAFASLGLKVMVTELDVDVLPSRGHSGIADVNRREEASPELNPYADGLPAGIQEKLARRYSELFDVYVKHRASITRVTFWGLDDGHSWLNHFPIRGRTNHPLLFDRGLKPKPAFGAVVAKGGKPRGQEPEKKVKPSGASGGR